MSHDHADEGIDAATTAVVIGAVILIIAFGVLVLSQRELAIASHESPAGPVGEGVPSRSPTPAGASASPAPMPRADRPGEYTVRPGESLFSVAAALGLSPNELVYWNADTYPTLRSSPALRPGWVLRTTGPPLSTPTARPTPAPTPEPELAATPVPGLPIITAAVFPAGDRVTVTWYPVEGATPAEILRSIDENGPFSQWVGGTATAHVEVRPSFDFVFRSSGAAGTCQVVATADPSVSISYSVLLPEWRPPAGGVSPATTEWWASQLTETVAHESQHITLYEQRLPEMQRAVDEGTCDSVEADLLDLWQAAVTANCEFDLAEYGLAAGLTLESCVAGGSG